MASTSYLARVIFAEYSDSQEDFSGEYRLLVRAKTIPSPASAPNTVESTTFEDDTQTFEMGIKTADSKEITGNLEKEYLQGINGLEGKKLNIIHLYGTQGTGEVVKYAYVGQAIATPNDVGGVDEILEMTATIIPNTAAAEITDLYDVVDNGDGTFTVTKDDGGLTNPTTEAVPGSSTLFNTSVSDMQENIVIGDDAITGTLKYLDTGDLAAYWVPGNFLALQFYDIDPNATSVKVGLRPTYGGPGGTTPIDNDSGLVEITTDPDKNGAFMINDNTIQKFKIVTSDGTHTKTKVYDLSGLVCNNS